MVSESVQMGTRGWRGILGYICPALSGWNEEYFYRVVPQGVGLMVVTLGLNEPSSDEQVKQVLSEVGGAAKKLAEWGANVIHIAGSPLALIKGRDGDKQIIKEIEETTKIPASTTLSAVVEALTALSVKKLVIADPSTEELGARRKRFFEESGFEVVKTRCLGIRRNSEVRKLPMYVPYTVAKEAYLEAPQADGIFLPCGSWGGPAVVECLEKDLGKPVVTGYQSFIWAGLKALNVREPVKGFGRLFETLQK